MIVRLNTNGDRWVARWTDATGQRKTRPIGPMSEITKREATKILATISSELLINPARGGKAPTLGQWRDKYLSLRRDELSDGTTYLHTLTFRYLVERFGEGARLDKISRLAAAEWAAELGLQEQSRCLHVRNAKVLFSWAVDAGLLAANPFARVNGTPAAMDKAWAHIGDAEMSKILAACPNDAWRRLFALCRWAGLRRGEAMRLSWGDVNFEAHTLTVRADKETTKARTRTVPLVPRLYSMLLSGHNEAGTDSSGPTDGVHGHNISHLADGIVAKAGLAEYAKPLHTLRKNCETEWMQNHPVLDVAAWLGHSPAVAAKHYVRPTAASIEKLTESGTKLARNPTPTVPQP